MPRLGVVGSLVWDQIHGWDSHAPAVEEWGGIAYSLAGLDAALGTDWQVIPLIKVGSDLAAEAAHFLGALECIPSGGRCVSVASANNRVTLRYESNERRSERMSGGVPGWTWPELGPMVEDLDAIYINFISGMELNLGTARALRHGFSGPIYADLHSLLMTIGPDGVRAPQQLPDVAEWCSCFDFVQLNEAELVQVASDPLTLAAAVMASGVSLLNVTLGSEGMVYVSEANSGRWNNIDSGFRATGTDGTSLRTAKIPAIVVDAIDPTGCGDVFGSTCFAQLLKGRSVELALRKANEAAARNATFRGVSGLSRHLRGRLVEA